MTQNVIAMMVIMMEMTSHDKITNSDKNCDNFLFILQNSDKKT